MNLNKEREIYIINSNSFETGTHLLSCSMNFLNKGDTKVRDFEKSYN